MLNIRQSKRNELYMYIIVENWKALLECPYNTGRLNTVTTSGYKLRRSTFFFSCDMEVTLKLCAFEQYK